MKKNFLKKAMSLALCAMMVTPATACGGGGSKVEIDETKTQLYVFHYFAGFGDQWLQNLAADFEAKMLEEGRSFEEGKVGVQVIKSGDMKDFADSSALKSAPYDVFFLEGPSNFIGLMDDNALEPLESIMTTTNTDGKTIESKMTAQQQAAYTYNGHYYGIPHYAGNYGLIYNREIFEAGNYFFAKNPDGNGADLEGRFISSPTQEKTVGPDGKTGTIDGIDYSDDDGLPRTYEEFFYLCQELSEGGYDPICWPGKYRQQHVTMLMDNMVANNLGAEQANIRYTFEGNAVNLVKFDDNGNPMTNPDGSFVTESMEINEGNAYNLARAEGVYQAFDFVQTILNEDAYWNEDGKNDGMSHTEMQQNFLENGSLGRKQSAMLADGTWWQTEANSVFEYMKENDDKYSKENRKFGWLPLPQANETEAAKLASGEKKLTFSDYLNAVACVKSGLSDGVREAALEFLKFAYTDEQLCKFTYTTSTTIGVDYLNQIDRTQLNYYMTTLINYLDKADIVYQVSPTVRYLRNRKSLQPSQVYGSGDYKDILTGTWDGKLSTLEFFKGHQAFYKGAAW